MVTRPSILYGQNFLRRAAVAERLVKLAKPSPSHLCIDIGAGNGIITNACLSTGLRVVAVEIDDRLAQKLHLRFGDHPRFKLVHESLLTTSLPTGPFSIISNPPFNQSTAILRRWVLDRQFESGAIIAQLEFGRKVMGYYGATKMSLAVAPFRKIDIPELVPSNFFHPQPKVSVAILRINRIKEPKIPWHLRQEYWLFINFLFERGRLTIGEALKPLRPLALPHRFRIMHVRDLNLDNTIKLFEMVSNTPGVWHQLRSFDRRLPENRRANYGDLKIINKPEKNNNHRNRSLKTTRNR